VAATGVPGERKEVEHAEEVDQRGDRQDEVAPPDQLVGPDLGLDGGVQGHQVVQLEDRADLEEGEGEGRADRRDQQIPEHEGVPEDELPGRVVEQLRHHRVGDQRQDDHLGGARAQEVVETIHEWNARV
jgi:hypothetical protein